MNYVLKKSLPLVLIFVLSLLANLSFAADTTMTGAGDPFVNVQKATCTVAKALQGPVGIAVGFLVLVGGLIAMQVANRDAIPMISRAVIGTALLIGAAAAFAAIVVDEGCA